MGSGGALEVRLTYQPQLSAPPQGSMFAASLVQLWDPLSCCSSSCRGGRKGQGVCAQRGLCALTASHLPPQTPLPQLPAASGPTSLVLLCGLRVPAAPRGMVSRASGPAHSLALSHLPLLSGPSVLWSWALTEAPGWGLQPALENAHTPHCPQPTRDTDASGPSTLSCSSRDTCCCQGLEAGPSSLAQAADAQVSFPWDNSLSTSWAAPPPRHRYGTGVTLCLRAHHLLVVGCLSV